MCGIFGVVNNDFTVPDQAKLKETSRLLHHRGPDNTGIYSDRGIGFVHTRLSLLDLDDRSNQPFWDLEKRYCIVYNGEIYNFKKLRSELEQQGVTFRTTSDTEVILHGLIQWGMESTLHKIEGMYAFAFYDKQKDLLYLVRDKFGIKPLFVYEKGGSLIFSSEIQAMKPWITFEPDIFSISAFLLGFAGPTKGSSFFKDIKILSPGTILKVQGGSVTSEKEFFSVTDLWDPNLATTLKNSDANDLIDKVDELLLNSVESQLFADAPVGALCSGGLDSSLIMAMAKKFHNNLAIFHANVVGKDSEYEAAYELANYLKLDLKEVRVEDEDFIRLFPEVIEHQGHPFYITPHSIPFSMVSKLVQASEVKAVLSGEGADEGFLGYSFLRPSYRFKMNSPVRSMVHLWKAYLHTHTGNNGKRVNRSRYLMGFSPYTSVARTSDQSNSKQTELPELLMGMLSHFEITAETDLIESSLKGGNDHISSQEYTNSFDLLNYNLRTLLHRNDTMGMAASIESRFPFLDSSLVKYAVNISSRQKIVFQFPPKVSNGMLLTDKWVLRKVAERYLPQEFFQRPKKGFPVNAFWRMRTDSSFFENSLTQDLFGLSNKETKYFYEHADKRLKLKLMHLEVWLQVFVHDLPRQDITDRLMDNITIEV